MAAFVASSAVVFMFLLVFPVFSHIPAISFAGHCSRRSSGAVQTLQDEQMGEASHHATERIKNAIA